MQFYDKDAKGIMDNEGLAYVVEIGYTQMIFKDAYDAIKYAKDTAIHANVDVHLHVIRRFNQYTGEVLEDEE